MEKFGRDRVMFSILTQNENGFTLIELMIVIAIIGILAAVAIPQFSLYRTRSFNAAAAADLRNAALAMEAYYTDHGRYTSDKDKLIGYYDSEGVVLQILSGSETNYTITVYHNSGDKTYSLIGPGGTATSN